MTTRYRCPSATCETSELRVIALATYQLAEDGRVDPADCENDGHIDDLASIHLIECVTCSTNGPISVFDGSGTTTQIVVDPAAHDCVAVTLPPEITPHGYLPGDTVSAERVGNTVVLTWDDECAGAQP